VFRKLKMDELNRLSRESFDALQKNPVVVVLDNIRSQHNVGAAFRTADAFALEGIFVCGISATPPSPEIHKSALGAEESVDWRYFADPVDAVAYLKEQGYTIISVEQTENSTMLQDMSLEKGGKYALIFGNEVKGVDQRVLDMSDLVLEIPQYGTKHSLNVSVSIGIVTWSVINALKQLFKTSEKNSHN
jgi:tRNA G18 (ribose-2'-O)-methylase SpoU